MFSRAPKILLCFFTGLFLFTGQGLCGNANWKKQIRSLAGRGAVLVVDSKGRELFALNPHKPLIPASTLKIVTASAALHYLGASYRFRTEFRLSPENDLYIIGRGDPHLISEELARIVHNLKSKGLKMVRNIYLDDSYFRKNLVLHGTNRSLNPYDAFNGALCVNFNTIFIWIEKNGKVHSAEPQTPLTDFAKKMGLKSGLMGRVRINLAESPEKCLLYTGELLKAFLEKDLIKVKGRVLRDKKKGKAFPVFYLHKSLWDLSQILKKIFKYSNNFMANQVFLTLGAEKFGPPATAEKSRRAVGEFLKYLGLPAIHVEEGSGISRRTHITASQMIKVLEYFRPHRSLFIQKERAFFKTGTLSDVKSMAGYLLPGNGSPLSFSILLNGKEYGQSNRDKIFKLIKKNLVK